MEQNLKSSRVMCTLFASVTASGRIDKHDRNNNLRDIKGHLTLAVLISCCALSSNKLLLRASWNKVCEI